MRKNRFSLIDVFNELYLRLVEVVGVFITFVAVMTFLAIFTYCAEDASFNTAIDCVVSNVVSTPGSYYSDIVVQIFGSASYIFSIVLFSAGVQLIRYHFISFWRFFLGMLCLPLMEIVANIFDLGFYSHGFIGKFVCQKLNILEFTKNQQNMVGYAIILITIVFLILSMKLDFAWMREKIKNIENFNSLKELLSFSVPVDFFAKYKDGKSEHEEPSLELIDEGEAVIDEDDEPHLRAKSKNSGKKDVVKSVPQRGWGNFKTPSLELLSLPKEKGHILSDSELKERANNLIAVLNDFGIQGEITGVSPGPVVTLYELKPAAGIKSSRVIGLSSDIARYMSAVSARVAVIPGRNALGIELPNENRQTVYLREILESKTYKRSGGALSVSLGKNIGGDPVVADLAKMPHLLVAGTTGSGKSVGVNAMIMSLLYKMTPEQCKFIMVDPKMLELSVYNDIPHLLTPVVTDPKKAVVALKWAVHEMESRYVNMSKLGVRNIEGYNAKLISMKKSGEAFTRQVNTGFDPETGAPIYETQTVNLEPIPYIVIIVDEMADLMLVAGKEIEIAVQRLAQMARAAGIHLIMATQRPSVDVITGTIKANFPTRISFQVSSKFDSRTILGEQGAEQLLGQGDMLYMASGGRTVRIHCPFVSDEEVEKVTTYLKQQGEPHYIDDILKSDDIDEGSSEGDASGDDPMYREAVDLIVNEGKASTSFLQRRLKIGYNRAARIIDMMEEAGVVSAPNHVGKREILAK